MSTVRLNAVLRAVRDQVLPGDLEDAICDIAARCPPRHRGLALRMARHVAGVASCEPRMHRSVNRRDTISTLSELHVAARGVRDMMLLLEVGDVPLDGDGDVIEEFVKRNINNCHLAAN